MKRFIIKKKTEYEWLKENMEWTYVESEAMLFGTKTLAVDFCEKNNIKEVYIKTYIKK